MILIDAPLNDVFHSVALLTEAHTEGMLCTKVVERTFCDGDVFCVDET